MSSEHFVKTVDGWLLAVRHHAPLQRTQPLPVVLCHGFAASGGSFELGRNTLVKYLVDEGHEVFVADLRGHGKSTHTLGRTRWSFSEYVEIDAPTIVNFAREVTNAARAHWVGHSMGGIIGLGHVIEDGAHTLASLCTVGSGLDYSATGSDWNLLRPLVPLMSRVPMVPIGLLAKLESRLDPVRTLFSGLNVWPGTSDRDLWKTICRDVFFDTSSGVVEQLIAGLEPGGFRSSRDPSLRYLAAAASITVPTMVTTGDRDRQCTPSAARRTFDAIGTDDKELVVFGRGRGDRHHYGHFDLLIGQHAHDEVFPTLGRWMQRHV